MHRCHAAAVLGYVPAVAHFKKEVWVDCHAVHPDTGTLKRKRYRLNYIKGIEARKREARDLVARINSQLRKGWNPWQKDQAPRGMHTFREVVEVYINSKARSTTNKSPNSYRNQALMLLRWCESKEIADQVVTFFNKRHAYQYMDYVRDERKVNGTTFNNYLLFSTIMFNWMVEREYRTDNPFQRIKRERVPEKLRTLILPHERAECLKWFEENDPSMVMVCMWVFHTLLRPRSELLRIRVGDIDLLNGVVNVGGDKSKSKRIRRPAIPHAMMPYLLECPALKMAPTDHVVGRGMRPGPEASGYNLMGTRWNKMRKALKWPKDKQLYSMRDSGIVQLIGDGVDLHAVMVQADHKDIATTNRYVQHYFPDGVQQVRMKASAFVGTPTGWVDAEEVKKVESTSLKGTVSMRSPIGKKGW